MADYPQVAARRAHAAAHAPEAHASRHGCSRVAAPLAYARDSRHGCSRVAAPLAYARDSRHGCSRVAAPLAYARDSRHGCSRVVVPLAYARDADASEECTHAAPAESMRSSVRRRRGCFRRMHACRACRVDALQRTSATRMLPKNAGMRRSRVLSCKLRFDAAEPRALDCPSLARRRTPSPLIPSPIYGIIYEFSDFWAQFWTIFKSTRPPSKS
jgi:hypothetical protein